MTEHETLPDQDLAAWPFDDIAAWDGADEWDGYPIEAAPRPAAPPWYRSPRLLLTLIAAAAAVLVVAAALLVSGNFSGGLPSIPQLDTRTATTGAPSPGPRSSDSAGPSSAASLTSTSEPSTPTASAEPPPSAEVPEESAEPAPPPLPAPPPTADVRPKEGPRINVTRTPMSFTPGQSAKP